MKRVVDPYRLLGVARGATQEQVKAAHRALAKRYHPDAPQGDRDRFLAVQEAYQTLSDPLRRRAWDAEHAPGPVRADRGTVRGRATPGAAQPGGRPPASARGPFGRATDADQTRRPDAAPQQGTTRGARGGWSASGRDPGSRRYTWSAAGVPWWEDAAHRDGRPGSGQPVADEPRASGPRRPPSDRTGDSREQSPRGVPGEFDVYSRSSGAAWSSAARAYYRRGDADLPRRGVFRRGEATRPVPGTDHAGHPQPHGRPPSSGRSPRDAGAAPPPASATARSAGRGPAGNGSAAGRTRHAAADPGRPPGAASSGAAWTRSGTQAATNDAPRTQRATEDRTADGRPRLSRRRPVTPSHAAPAAMNGVGAKAGIGPALGERITLAALGWLPLALLIGYGGGAITGCDRSAASCSPVVEPLQATLIVVALAAMVLWPKLAYAATAGAAGMVAASLVLAFVAAIVGAPTPLPVPFAAVGVATVVAAYLLAAGWAVRNATPGSPLARRRAGGAG